MDVHRFVGPPRMLFGQRLVRTRKLEQYVAAASEILLRDNSADVADLLTGLGLEGADEMEALAKVVIEGALSHPGQEAQHALLVRALSARLPRFLRPEIGARSLNGTFLDELQLAYEAAIPDKSYPRFAPLLCHLALTRSIYYKVVFHIITTIMKSLNAGETLDDVQVGFIQEIWAGSKMSLRPGCKEFADANGLQAIVPSSKGGASVSFASSIKALNLKPMRQTTRLPRTDENEAASEREVAGPPGSATGQGVFRFNPAAPEFSPLCKASPKTQTKTREMRISIFGPHTVFTVNLGVSKREEPANLKFRLCMALKMRGMIVDPWQITLMHEGKELYTRGRLATTSTACAFVAYEPPEYAPDLPRYGPPGAWAFMNPSAMESALERLQWRADKTRVAAEGAALQAERAVLHAKFEAEHALLRAKFEAEQAVLDGRLADSEGLQTELTRRYCALAETVSLLGQRLKYEMQHLASRGNARGPYARHTDHEDSESTHMRPGFVQLAFLQLRDADRMRFREVERAIRRASFDCDAANEMPPGSTIGAAWEILERRVCSNYEKFMLLEPGSANLGDVSKTTLGVLGWYSQNAAVIDNDPLLALLNDTTVFVTDLGAWIPYQRFLKEYQAKCRELRGSDYHEPLISDKLAPALAEFQARCVEDARPDWANPGDPVHGKWILGLRGAGDRPSAAGAAPSDA